MEKKKKIFIGIIVLLIVTGLLYLKYRKNSIGLSIKIREKTYII